MKGDDAELPEIEFGGDYLIDYLFDIGVGKPSAMGGLIPLDNLDLAAWQQNNRISLEVWEIQQIRSLSREYCSCLAKFSDPHEPPPYTAHKVMTPEKKDRIAAAFRSWTTRKG